MGEPRGKKKKLENGYKDKPNRYCWYTGQPCAERHEVFSGIHRQTSIDMGFQIDVCSQIHYALQYGTTAWAREEVTRLKKYFQLKYEDDLISEGYTQEQAREEWMLLIGENYL